MQRQFARWAIFTFIILGLSSAVGIVVNAVVDPHKERYNSTYIQTYQPTPTPQPYYRTDLQAGPEWFSNPLPAPVYQKTMYTEAINSVIANHGLIRAGQIFSGGFPNYFHTNRMAEEWVRFGVYQYRDVQANNGTIGNDATIIHQELLALAAKDVPAFRPSKVSIEWVTASNDGNDAMVLAKHVGKVNDVAVTWYARWWLTQQYSVWKVYDVQLVVDPFRLNARIAGEKMFNNSPMDRYPRDGVTTELKSLASRLHAMQRSGVKSVLNQRADGDSYVYISPIEAVKLLVTSQLSATRTPTGQLQTELQRDSTKWDVPLSDLMIADLSLDKAWIDSFRKKAGNHPWAFALEARILLKQSQKQKAAEVLSKGLKETPGDPVLLIEMYRQTTPGQRAAIGELAASGATPGESLAALYDTFFADAADLEAIIESYRSIRPQDATGATALAAVRYTQGRFDDARKLFQAAVAGANDESFVDAKTQLAKWCALSAKERSDVILKQTKFQSVIQK
ncbi:hypothetical protein BH11PLA2_BH11PLA2_05070 [soil metagenome]